MPYDASSVNFKIKGKPNTGCRYIVVQWKPGKGAKRELRSCHRTQKTAKAAYHATIRKMKSAPKYLLPSMWATGVYDLKTGKKVESWTPPKRKGIAGKIKQRVNLRRMGFK